MAAHWSRLAMAPDMAQQMTAGSERLTVAPRLRPRSYRDHPIALERSLHSLTLGQLERPADRRARLAWIDDVVDHRVAGSHVDVDARLDALNELPALGRGVFGLLHLPAKDDL